MENNEVKNTEVKVEETPATAPEQVASETETKVETPAPAEETPVEAPTNPLIDATVKELSDKMGFRGN